MRYPILFAALTALCWGLYGPALGEARSSLASPFKPYFAIGAADLTWGLVGGALGRRLNGDPFWFSGSGSSWGLVAGSVGAWGALALTLAMFSGGTAMPQIIMPIVFGGAVTVTALVAVARQQESSPMLWVGILVVAAGIVLVAYNTPHPTPGNAATSDVSR